MSMLNLSFDSLPEAQAHAKALSIPQYYRVWFDDAASSAMRDRGGWWTKSIARFKIYMSLEDAIEIIRSRASSTLERTTIETLFTAQVSDSPKAR
jgi:streptogramin lyase